MATMTSAVPEPGDNVVELVKREPATAQLLPPPDVLIRPSGWYPHGGQGLERWFDGMQWTPYTRIPPPPVYYPPTAPASPPYPGWVAPVIVGVCAAIAILLATQPVSLLSGAGSTWEAVLAAAIGFGASLLLRSQTWLSVVAAMLLTLLILNGLSVEKQLQDRRNEVTSILNGN